MKKRKILDLIEEQTGVSICSDFDDGKTLIIFTKSAGSEINLTRKETRKLIFELINELKKLTK